MMLIKRLQSHQNGEIPKEYGNFFVEMEAPARKDDEVPNMLQLFGRNGFEDR